MRKPGQRSWSHPSLLLVSHTETHCTLEYWCAHVDFVGVLVLYVIFVGVPSISGAEVVQPVVTNTTADEVKAVPASPSPVPEPVPASEPEPAPVKAPLKYTQIALLQAY